MPYLSYSNCLFLLSALFVVLIPSTLGSAAPQDGAEAGAVAVGSSEISVMPLDGNTSPAVTGEGTEAGGLSTGGTA